jgi:hypothetical protein
MNEEELFYRIYPLEVKGERVPRSQAQRYDGQDQFFNDLALRSNAASSEARKYLSGLRVHSSMGLKSKLKPTDTPESIARDIKFICRATGLTDEQANDLVSPLTENINYIFR